PRSVSPQGTVLPCPGGVARGIPREMSTMAALRDSRSSGNESLDSLLSRAQRVRSSSPGVELRPAVAAQPTEAPVAGEVVPWPGEGCQVEEEWLREERLSLTEFTRRQFQAIRQQQAQLEAQRQDLLRRQNEFNESCLLKQQELNRQVKVLAA